MSKVINLHGVVGWDIMAKDVNTLIDEAEGELVFDMNSGGGYITEGVAILNKIRSYKGGKTIARVSYSASMMTQIALACDEVQVYDNAIFMIHNAQGYASGDHNEMTARAKHLKAMSGMLANLYVKKTGKDKKEIQKMMDETTYMFGQDIIDNGFADTLIESENGEDDKAMAVTTATVNWGKSLKALEEESLSPSQLDDAIKMCKSGNCDLATMPSSEKIANSTQGKTVKKTPEELQKLLDTANTTIEANKTSLDGKDAEILALNEKVTALSASAKEHETLMAKAVSDSKDEAKKELLEEFKGIMAMVMEAGAPKEVALEVASCTSQEEAKTKLAESMISAGITFGGDSSQNTSSEANHGWDNIMKKGK